MIEFSGAIVPAGRALTGHWLTGLPWLFSMAIEANPRGTIILKDPWEGLTFPPITSITMPSRVAWFFTFSLSVLPFGSSMTVPEILSPT